MNKSDYQDCFTIIPFRYDVTLGYRIGLYNDVGTQVRLVAQVARDHAWATGVSITFKALLIK